MIKLGYYKKLLVIILMTSMLPVIVFSIYSVVKNNIDLRGKVKENNFALLAKTQASVEETLQFIQSYYTILTLYEGVSDWTDAAVDYTDIKSISEIQRKFSGGIITYDVIKDVALINSQQKWVISQSKVYDMGMASSYDQVLSYIEKDGKIFWQFIPSASPDENELLKGNISLIIKAGSSFLNDSPLTLVVTLSSYQFDKLMKKNDYGFPVIVIDDSGTIVYDVKKENIGKNYTEISFLAELDVSRLGEKGAFTDTSNKIYGNYIKSNFNDFIYISTYTNADIRFAADAIADYTIIVGGVLTMALLLLTFLESRFMYKPIKKVVQDMPHKLPGTQYKDELDMINHNIKQLISTNADLRTELEQYQPVLKELFLIKIIEGRASAKDIEETAKELDIYDKWVYMIIMLIQIDSPDSGGINNDIMLLESFRIASGIIPEDLCLKSIISHGKAVFLIGSQHEMLENFMETLYEYGQSISMQVKKTIGLEATLGMSTVFCEFDYAQKAYRESHNVLVYKSFLAGNIDEDKENILFFDNLKPNSESENQYPKEIVAELMQAISNLNEPLVAEKLNEVLKAIYSHKNIINEFQFYLLRLTADIILVLDVSYHYDKIFNSQATILEELNKITNQNDMRQFFYEKLIKSVMDTIRENATPQDIIIEKVMGIIHEDYMTDLSIESCAQRLNYHPTYIWRLMKTKLNTTFQDYLIHYRIKMAEKWLTETDMTVAEIAEKLRYNNSQNFIRTFKKVVGTTPGKYRGQ